MSYLRKQKHRTVRILRKLLLPFGYHGRRIKSLDKRSNKCYERHLRNSLDAAFEESEMHRKKAEWYKKDVDLATVFDVEIDRETFCAYAEVVCNGDKSLASVQLHQIFGIDIPSVWID